jgi:hypothetical protein
MHDIYVPTTKPFPCPVPHSLTDAKGKYDLVYEASLRAYFIIGGTFVKTTVSVNLEARILPVVGQRVQRGVFTQAFRNHHRPLRGVRGT